MADKAPTDRAFELIVYGALRALPSSRHPTLPGGRSSMSVLEALIIIAAGFVAGTINTDRRLGLADHLPDPARPRLLAGHRQREQHRRDRVRQHQRRGRLPARARRPAPPRAGARRAASVLGALIGGVLLLTLPSSVFDAVVPVLILLAWCS